MCSTSPQLHRRPLPQGTEWYDTRVTGLLPKQEFLLCLSPSCPQKCVSVVKPALVSLVDAGTNLGHRHLAFSCQGLPPLMGILMWDLFIQTLVIQQSYFR